MGAQIGHPVYEETRLKISDTIKRKFKEDPDYKRKVTEANNKRFESPKERQKISESIKKLYEDPENRKKISDAIKTKWKDPEYRKKMSIARKGKHPSEETKHKRSVALKGHHGYWLGKHPSEETRKKLSEANKGKYCGEKHHNWKGGISFEPYCPKFNNEFKERVRAFFNFQCVECGTPQNGKKLHVHHINFNKMSCCDNTLPLFVSLCDSCHGKSGFNREYWENHFTEMIQNYYGGQCYLPVGMTYG